MLTPPILSHPVYELLEVICSQLVQRNAAQLWSDVQPNKILIASLGVWTDDGLAVIFVPELHPLTEGHICSDLDGGRRSCGAFQYIQLLNALRLGLGQLIRRSRSGRL